MLLLGTENLQRGGWGATAFSPRWFSLHLGTGCCDLVRSVEAWQTARGTACEPRQLAADLPEHFRRLHFNSSRPLACLPLSRPTPLANKSWHASSESRLRAHHGHGSAHQPHIFHYTFICSEKTFTFPPHPVESSRQFRRQSLGVQNVGDHIRRFCVPPPRGSPGRATLACSCSRHRRSSTRTLPR